MSNGPIKAYSVPVGVEQDWSFGTYGYKAATAEIKFKIDYGDASEPARTIYVWVVEYGQEYNTPGPKLANGNLRPGVYQVDNVAHNVYQTVTGAYVQNGGPDDISDLWPNNPNKAWYLEVWSTQVGFDLLGCSS